MSHRVTILMPIYNVGKYLRDSIDSVLAQTYHDLKLLILDDCSSDNSRDIVASYFDSRIQYVHNDFNLGLADNLNKGLSLVQTELVARMDGDDIAEPTWLEENIKVLDANPEIGICSSGFQFFGTKDSLVRYPQNHEDSKVQMLFGCTICVPVMRMSLIRKFNLQYNSDSFPAEDYELWSRCYPLTKVYNIQKTLFRYRMHPSQISTSKRLAQIEKTNQVRLRMLAMLNPVLSDKDKNYFIHEFCDARIISKSDIKTMKDFVNNLLDVNSYGFYDSYALTKRFEMQLQLAVYNYVIRTFFNNGYSISHYACYLFSGCAHHIPFLYQIKILYKCLSRY